MACQIFLNAKNALMDEMKSSIRKFLALTKMTRDEFADLCGVSKSQVDKWLSTVPIPRARQRLIIRIMKEEYAKQARLAQTKNPNSIHAPVTPQKYEKFRNEAERHGLTVPEWASEALDALSIAEECGSVKAVNVVLLGAASRDLPFDEEAWIKVIEENVKPKFVELNKKAFALGINA